MNKAGQQLKILPHHVLNDKEEPVELCSSVECKGIIGNDGRHYILDLLRTFPPDVNFLKRIYFFTKMLPTYKIAILVDEEELSKEVKMLGFPIEHKHKLCCLRQELIDSFVDSRYMMFIKYAAFHLQQLNLKKNKVILSNKKELEEKNNHIEAEEAKKIVESITDGGNKLERMCYIALIELSPNTFFLQ